MKVLIIGAGAREHALAWNFSKSNRISGLFIAPGNAGTAELGENLDDLNIENHQEILNKVKKLGINLVFVGPEQPLAEGLVDILEQNGVPAIGPDKSSARLESSKTFSKEFMIRNNIPTAAAEEFSDVKKFEAYIRKSNGMQVIKKSGLAAGKGVFESDSKDDLIAFGKDILKNDSLLVEEFLTGYEISIFTLSDGKNYLVLPPCADFKKAGENDSGLNTGGMGAICPVPNIPAALMTQIKEEVLERTFDGLNRENLNYKGVLYFGLMITEQGPKLLEYNARLGDPEAQVLLPLIQSDFVNLCDAIIHQTLADFPLQISEDSALGIVIASKGYPGAYQKKLPVTFDKENNIGSLCFHASTILHEGKVLTNGGRCFTIIGRGPNLLNASVQAYNSVKNVRFDGSWYRTDIGKKFYRE